MRPGPAITFLFLATNAAVLASDHADPLDLLDRRPHEQILTGLFVFPVDEQGAVVAPFERADGVRLHDPDLAERPRLTTAEQSRIRDLVVIVGVYPGLTDSDPLDLDDYTYTVNIDTDATVDFSDAWARGRYGGRLGRDQAITPSIRISVELEVKRVGGDRTVTGTLAQSGLPRDPTLMTGIFDDPFIFPMFTGTNIVAIALRIPYADLEKAHPCDLLVWATSHEGRTQRDHVGRSLRTQNPRFDRLNTLPPGEHVAAIEREIERRSLMRDLKLRLNLRSLFAYRAWDVAPDVLIYSTRYPVGFPNGRLLTDDVVALTAQLGDTLAFELSYFNGAPGDPVVPRATRNDRDFRAAFPYLASKHTGTAGPTGHTLRPANVFKILVILAAAAGVLLIVIVVAVRWLDWKRHRRRYL